MIKKQFKRTNCIFLSFFPIIFFLFSCTTAPRYARQKNPPPEQNRDQQQIKIPIAKQETLVQSQMPLPENSPGSSEIPLESPRQNEPIFTQNGTATYYADKFHGRRTAFGEKYDKFELTAAHLTLPFNTIVKVTCIDNEKFVIVRINDRGPHGTNRIIDLSRAAAKEIDLIQRGVAKVKLEVFDNRSASK